MIYRQLAIRIGTPVHGNPVRPCKIDNGCDMKLMVSIIVWLDISISQSLKHHWYNASNIEMMDGFPPFQCSDVIRAFRRLI